MGFALQCANSQASGIGIYSIGTDAISSVLGGGQGGRRLKITAGRESSHREM
jgi:hypothetical protein